MNNSKRRIRTVVKTELEDMDFHFCLINVLAWGQHAGVFQALHLVFAALD